MVQNWAVKSDAYLVVLMGNMLAAQMVAFPVVNWVDWKAVWTAEQMAAEMVVWMVPC